MPRPTLFEGWVLLLCFIHVEIAVQTNWFVQGHKDIIKCGCQTQILVFYSTIMRLPQLLHGAMQSMHRVWLCRPKTWCIGRKTQPLLSCVHLVETLCKQPRGPNLCWQESNQEAEIISRGFYQSHSWHGCQKGQDNFCDGYLRKAKPPSMMNI